MLSVAVEIRTISSYCYSEGFRRVELSRRLKTNSWEESLANGPLLTIINYAFVSVFPGSYT